MDPNPVEEPTNLTLPKISSGWKPKGKYGNNITQTAPLPNFSPLFNLPDNDSIDKWGSKIRGDAGDDNINLISGKTHTTSSTSISSSKPHIYQLEGFMTSSHIYIKYRVHLNMFTSISFYGTLQT